MLGALTKSIHVSGGNGQIRSPCSSSLPCDVGLTCSDDGTGTNRMPCYIDTGSLCTNNAECAPASTCAAKFDSNGSYDGSSCNDKAAVPSENDLRRRCNVASGTSCQGAPQPASCIPNGPSPSFCQSTAGATCFENSDCYQKEYHILSTLYAAHH
jgi:hypothetical protein